ncbi:MAG: CRTAC1 family protein [Planctomycetota bacterium]|jgi:hypothetical protein
MHAAVLLAIFAMPAGSTGALAPDVHFRFVDVSADRGLGPYAMEFGMGGGAAAADYDDDGDIDVFVPNGRGAADQLYRNRGDGTFEEIAGPAGLASTASARCALWLDYDGDLDLDLLVANDDPARPSAYRLHRQVHPGLFDDVTAAAGLLLPLPPPTGTGAIVHRGGLAAGDLNGDGWLDVYAAVWNGPPHLFLHNGDAEAPAFVDVTDESGVMDAECYGHQALMADFDGDDRLDIYVAIDFLWNALWINGGDGTFEDAAPEANADNAMNDMGIACADPDADGDLDLYVTNIYQAPTQYSILLRNDTGVAGPAFTEVALDWGVGDGSWGWGATFLDADLDGRVDLAATNGWVTPLFRTDSSRFFLNRAGAAGPTPFADVSGAVGFDDKEWGSCLLALDADRDGDLDLLQTCMDGPLRLLDARRRGPAADRHWLVVRPRMHGPNHRAIGAVITLRQGATSRARLVTAGTSYLGQEPAEAHFGLADAAAADEVRVAWPGGGVTVLRDVPADRVITVWPDGGIE